jgi:hypothetical protein
VRGIYLTIIALIAIGVYSGPSVYGSPWADPSLRRIIVPIGEGTDIAVSFMDEDGIAALIASPSGGVEGHFSWCFVGPSEEGQTATVSNNLAPAADTCEVNEDPDSEMELLTIHAHYICDAAGTVAFRLEDGGGSSNSVTLTCGAADLSPSEVLRATLHPQQRGGGMGKATLTPIEDHFVVSAEVRRLEPLGQYFIRVGDLDGTCFVGGGPLYTDLKGSGAFTWHFPASFLANCVQPYEIAIEEALPGGGVGTVLTGRFK